jgi:hypothetical protein
LMRSFNFSPRKPFALFTAHITIISRRTTDPRKLAASPE